MTTPVNWKSGEDVIIVGSVSDQDAEKAYPQGWRAPQPSLRFVPQPPPEQTAKRYQGGTRGTVSSLICCSTLAPDRIRGDSVVPEVEGLRHQAVSLARLRDVTA